MSYHPKQIMTTALYLATKTENHHNSARSFAAKLAAVPGLETTKPEDVLAPEYLLVQGLRFCFDVRHPHRALKGAYLDLQGLHKIASGSQPPKSWSQTGVGLQKKLMAHLADRYGPPARLSKRIEAAYSKARETLQRQAIMSDVYFLYTPSQIMMAALWMADDKLVVDLLHAKANVVPDNSHSRARATVDRILDEIEACATEMKKTELEDTAHQKEAKRIDRKLHFCRNPDKLDLVKLNQATKRDATENGKLEDGIAKKRKLEREALEKEGEDLFGPALVKKEEDMN
jgi:cyclin H